MASVNEVRIMGNLGQDPELRYTQSGKAVATLSIATTRQWRDKDDKVQEETEWHRVVVWGTQAEAVTKHKSKGDQLYVEGRLATRKYTDKDGVDRWSTEVAASRVLFTGRAPTNRRNDPHPADLEDEPPPPTDYDLR